MTEAESDYGRIVGIRVANKSAKPIRSSLTAPGRWKDAWEHFQPLPVNGSKATVVTLETKKDAGRLNSSIHGYADKRNCRAEGWKPRMEVHPRPDGQFDVWMWKEPI